MKKRLSGNWHWFLLILLASAILWQSVFSVVCAPKKQECLQLFVTADRCDSKMIQAALAALPVKQVNVRCQSSSNPYYQDQLTTSGIMNSDLLILHSSIFEMEYAWQEFAPLDAELLMQYGLAPEQYSYVSCNGRNYAIVIHDESRGISLLGEYLELCEPGKQYCIAVNVNMPNARPFSEGEDTTDHAFLALAKLLGGK